MTGVMAAITVIARTEDLGDLPVERAANPEVWRETALV